MLTGKNFRTDRGLAQYGLEFGAEFIKKVNSLGPNDVWVDLGAGDAIALKEYLTAKSIPGFNLPPVALRAKVIAVGASPKTNRSLRLWWLNQKLKNVLEKYGVDRFREVNGLFRSIPDSAMNDASLTTSAMGVLSYDQIDEFPEDLARALRLTREGGQLFFMTQDENLNFRHPSGRRFVNGEGQPDRVREYEVIQDYFSQVDGSRIIQKPTLSDRPVFSIGLLRTQGDPHAPPFQEHDFTSSRPPMRSVLWEGCIGEQLISRLRRSDQ